MTTAYPGGIDNLTDPGATLGGPPTHQSLHVNLNDAVEAIETELGVNPSGAAASVASRFSTLDASLSKITPVIGALTSFGPTVTQSNSVARTASYCKFQRVGRVVHYWGWLTITGSGTGGNGITVELPYTAAVASFTVVGVGRIYDTSAGLWYPGVAVIATTTSLGIAMDTAGGSGGLYGNQVFTAGLAVNDEIHFHIAYEAASD